MCISTAVESAQLLNSSNIQSDENLFYYEVRSPRGKLIASAEGCDPIELKNLVCKKAVETGYSEKYIKVKMVAADRVPLKWQSIPYIKPINTPTDWLDIEEWFTICEQNKLDPQLQITMPEDPGSAYSIEVPTVSLKLWNTRVAFSQ